MHDMPLSAEDRGTLLKAVVVLPPRDRLLAELVFGHGLALGDALSIRVEESAWATAQVKLVAHGPRSARRTVTVRRDLVQEILGDRRQGPLFATASGVPIRADYASRLLHRVAETAGVPTNVTVRRTRSRLSVAGR
jgi:site-specific recombinase XerC